MRNNMKRLLALFVSATCLFTMPVFTGAEDEAVENLQAQTVSQTTEETKQVPKVIEVEAGFLSALGILPDDVDFDSYITREDTAVLLCKLLAREDLAESYSNMSYYEDVSVYSENVGYINVVTNEGLFRGRSETIFDPASPITYAELAKLLVTATGYDIQADRMGGYPDGYLSVASQLKIINNLSHGGSAPVKWGDAVKMVYEAMYVDVLQSTSFVGNGVSVEKVEGQNILTIYHNLSWDKGQVTATAKNKLYGMGLSDDLDIGEIEIGGRRFTYDTKKLTRIDDLTGYRVEYFYRESERGGYEVVYVSAKDNNEITVSSYDIREVYGLDAGESGSAYLKYFDKETMAKADQLSLDKELSLIVNDSTMPDVSNAALLPDCGSVTLIDSDNDRKYDVAKVLDYQVRIIDTVSTYDQHIFFKETLETPGSTVPLVLNPVYRNVYYEVTCDGEEISLMNLYEGDVVGIIESEKDDFTYYRIELLSSYIEGVVEAYSEDEVVVDGKTYKVAPEFDFEAYGIELGESYKLYFDYVDRLFHAEGEEDIYFNYVLIGAGLKREGATQVAQVKLFWTPSVREKKVLVYDLAKNVKINGKRCKPAEVLDELKLDHYEYTQVYNDYYIQPVKHVEFNDEGQITLLETVQEITGGNASRTYAGTGPFNEGFMDKDGTRHNITYETQVFYLPVSKRDDDYPVGEYGVLYFGDAYQTILWGETTDSEGNTYPECVFVYHGDADGSTSDPSYLIDYSLPMLVSGTKMVYDSASQEYLPRIETYNSGAKFTYTADSRNPNRQALEELKIGDIFYPALAKKTQNVATKVQLIPEGKMWTGEKYISLSDRTLYYFNQVDQFYGRVETLRVDPRRSKCDITAFVGEEETRSLSLAGVPIYYYDRGENKVTLATYAAVKPAEVYGQQDASKIYVAFDQNFVDADGNNRPKAMMAVIVGEK